MFRPCRRATESYWDSIDWELPLGDIAKPMEDLWPQKSESNFLLYPFLSKFDD